VQDDAVDCSKIKLKGARVLARIIDVARLCGDDYTGGMLSLINPVLRAEPFDDPAWLFEPKFDAFRGRLTSRNGNRMQRFEGVLDRLPKGHCCLQHEMKDCAP
jgi:hypothetical protein